MDPAIIAAIITGGIDLLQMLFPGKKKQETTQTMQTTTPPPQPRSALYGYLESPITQMLLSQFNRLQGAGYPGGQGLGMDETIRKLMEMLRGNWQEIMDASRYKGVGTVRHTARGAPAGASGIASMRSLL